MFHKVQQVAFAFPLRRRFGVGPLSLATNGPGCVSADRTQSKTPGDYPQIGLFQGLPRNAAKPGSPPAHTHACSPPGVHLNLSTQVFRSRAHLSSLICPSRKRRSTSLRQEDKSRVRSAQNLDSQLSAARPPRMLPSAAENACRDTTFAGRQRAMK